MERINGSAVAVDLHGAGKDGFRDGNKALGIAATVVNAEFMNGVQEEIINVIEEAGLTPDAEDNTQLLQAITNLVKGPADKIVRVASTAAINLAAPGASIDGVAMVAGDTFLEKNHATLASRGIYVWNGAAVPATRDPSADAGDELFGGMIIRVKEGAANADTNWQVTNDGAVTIGTTGLTFQQIGAPVASVMPGAIAHYAMSTAPTGWLKANGAAVSRTTYAALYTAIGTTFGVGDGSTTFNLPDLRGEFIRGWDDARGIDSGRVFGSAQGDAIRNITGTFIASDDNGSTGVFTTGSGPGVEAFGTVASKTITFNASTVVPTAAENRPRNIALLACIKY